MSCVNAAILGLANLPDNANAGMDCCCMSCYRFKAKHDLANTWRMKPPSEPGRMEVLCDRCVLLICNNGCDRYNGKSGDGWGIAMQLCKQCGSVYPRRRIRSMAI